MNDGQNIFSDAEGSTGPIGDAIIDAAKEAAETDVDAGATAARIELTRACAQVIKTGLYLIGVSAPERM